MRFSDFVAARWPTPEDALLAFFQDAQAAAAGVGILLNEVPDLKGRRTYLPNLAGVRDKRQFAVASVVLDRDGTAWPAITFKSFRHGGCAVFWKPRDAAWNLFQCADRTANVDSTNLRNAYAIRAIEATRAARQRAAERDQADTAGRIAAAEAAAATWELASPDCTEHPYLRMKGVQHAGLRVSIVTRRGKLWDAERQRWIDNSIIARAGDLLVPIHDRSGRMVNLQRIDAAGRKLFVRGGQKRGSFYRIPGEGDTWIVEGLATGLSVHEATGHPVLVAFDAGNIATVADLGHRIAADHDASGTGQRAAEATGLPWAMPPQVSEDFNDLHMRAGLDAVRAALGCVRGPAPAEAPAFERVFDFPKVADLPTSREDALRMLAGITAPADAAAAAWAIAKRLSLAVPMREHLETIASDIRNAVPRHVLADATLRAIESGVAKIIDRRRRTSVAGVTPSPGATSTHTVERLNTLPTLTASDYRGVIIVRAPMGTGKTQRIGVPFSRWAALQDGRFVALAHRQSLIEELATRLNCEHYQRVSGAEASHVDSFATCLPSIVKDGHAQIFRECRWLFVDEISQVVRSLAAGVTVADSKSMGDVLEALRATISAAECVIVTDAGIDDRTIRFLESCRPGERFRYVDVSIPSDEHRTATFGYGPDALAQAYAEMLAELADGRRLWIACGEKSRAVECARLLESSGRRVLLVTSDNAGTREQAELLAEPDRLSRLYDAVIASPVISSGVSIEHRQGAWFDRVFLLASGATITPADAMQQARRVRYVRDLTVVVTPSNRREIESADAILQGLSEAAELEGRPALATDLDGLVADIKASEARQRADFSAGLWWLLELNRYAVCPMESVDSEVTYANLKQLRSEIARERCDAILAARDLTDMEARRLRDRPLIGEDDKAALLRYRIVRDLGLVEPPTVADLADWDDGRGPRAWDRWTAATARSAEAVSNLDVADLHRRRFGRARVAAYAELFAGMDIGPGFRLTSEVTERLLVRMMDRRQLLAVLGIVPAKWAGTRFTKPTGNAATRAMGDLFERMGLRLKRREGTATPKNPKDTLGCNTTFGGGSERNRWYEVTVESWARTAELAIRRNARRPMERVPVDSADDRHWLSVRRHIAARSLPPMEAAQLISTKWREHGATGHTYGLRVTAFWLRHVYAPAWHGATPPS